MPGVINRQTADGGHDLGAIGQGQPFQRFQLQRLQAAECQGPGTGYPAALKKSLPLTDQHQAEMGQGAQVSAGAHRPLFGDYGTNVAVQQPHQMPDRFKPDACVPSGQVLDPQGHDRPYGFHVQAAPDPGGMAHQNIFLEQSGVPS